MMRALVFCLFLLVVNCFVAVQKIDDLQSFTVAGITLDGNCVGTCVDPDQPGGARQAVQAQAAPGEYIIPGSLYRSATASGRMDYRELFISSSIQDTPNDIQIETLTEQGFWKINFPTTTDAVYTSILTYDGNSGDPEDPFYYDRDVLSLDLTRPGSFSNGSAASLPPAFGFQFLASSDLTSTFSFRVISDDFRGSQLTVTIPQGSSIEIFAPFYLFTAIPAGDSGVGGRGQHKQMTGQPADFTDVSVLSFIFETTKAVDAQLSFVSLITGSINVRVFLDCTGTTCIFDNSDQILTGVSLTISGDPSSPAIFPTSTVTYQNTTIAPGFSTLDERGYYAFFIDAGVYQVCVGNLPNGVTLVTSGCVGTTVNGCYTGSIGNTYNDIFIDIPVTANLAVTAPPPTTVDCGIAATATAVAFTGTATATGCGTNLTPSPSDSITNICTGSYLITRTWSVTQGQQTRSSVQLITVTDTTRPVIGPVLNTVVACRACTSSAATCLGTPNVSDNCGGVINAVPSLDTSVGNNCIRTFTRTWNAVDPCGNTATPVIQTFTVQDVDDPVFTSDPQDRTIPCGTQPIFDTLFATDPCQVTASVSTSDQDVSSGCNLSVRRIFTANDGCGRTVTTDQILTANAAGAPTLTDPQDLTVFCTSSLTPTALGSTSTAIDSCTGGAIPGVTFSDINNPFTNAPHQLGSSCSRSFQRVWSISTNCGGTTSTSQFITVTDNTDPFFTSFVTSPSPVQCASNQCTCVGTAPVPSASDACSTVTTTFRDTLPSGDSCVQTTVRVWTATDACGRFINSNQNIVREDVADPILSLPIPTAIYPCVGGFSNVPAPTVAERPNAIDCQANVNITPRTPVPNVPATTACDSVYTRIWDANDGCGNTASISQTVIVRDNIAPSFSFFPQDTTVNCVGAAAATSPSAPNNRPTATDACTQPSLTFNDLPPSGTLCPNGIQVSRVWTATDSCGLSTVDTQVFTITNPNDPEITISPSTLVSPCDAPYSPDALGSTATIDTDCDVATQITFFDVLTGSCPVTVRRTFVVTDGCDRTARTTQTIQLVDNEDPSFTNFPDDVTISCASSDDPDVDTGAPGVIDNCDTTPFLDFSDTVIPGTIGPGLCPGDDVTLRTWVVIDSCGRSTSQVQTITIVNRPPDECDPVECIPQPCDTSSCPVPNCDCCGAPAVNCLPVNCNPQPCNPVDCTPVPCSGCDIDIAVTGCQPRTCPPRYVYVDDDDVENFQKAQPAQANPKVSGASQLVLSCMLLLASVGSIFVALF